MSNLKAIIRKAIKHGFDLSGIPDYNPVKFKDGLDVFQEAAEVEISGVTMKVKPLVETGFFEILIELFRYVGIAAKEEKLPTQKNSDEKTTEDCDSDDSEELWL